MYLAKRGMNNDAGTSCGMGKVPSVFLLMFPSFIHLASYKGFSLLIVYAFSVCRKIFCVCWVFNLFVFWVLFLLQRLS